MTTQDQSRADFEAWCISEGHDIRRDKKHPSEYLCNYTCRAWDAVEAARALPAGMEPVAGQCRFVGEVEWRPCAVEHVSMVLKAPHGWEGYEVRYLYAAAPRPPAAQERKPLTINEIAGALQRAGIVPPGWQAVPMNADGSMVEAAEGVDDFYRLGLSPSVWNAVFRAMCAAAPRPPAAPTQQQLQKLAAWMAAPSDLDDDKESTCPKK